MQSHRQSAGTHLLELAFILLAWGCVPELPEHDGIAVRELDEVAELSQGITGSSLTTEVPWVVRLDMPDMWCSGLVLTEHFVLTAGHCVEDYGNLVALTVQWAHVAGGKQSLYTGTAQVLKNPEFHPEQWFGDPDEDVALLRLGGLGVNLALTGRAKLWGWSHPDINRDPWEQSSKQNRLFAAVGWGDTGSDSDCVDGSLQRKRIGYNFRVDATGADAAHVTAPIGLTRTCKGDSGGPWLFLRGGQFIAFAITGSYIPDLEVGGDYQRAALIKVKRDWLYHASLATDRKLICASAGLAGSDANGVTYEQCREQVNAPQPPPGPACPSGQHCCEPAPGGICRRCVPNSLECN